MSPALFTHIPIPDIPGGRGGRLEEQQPTLLKEAGFPFLLQHHLPSPHLPAFSPPVISDEYCRTFRAYLIPRPSHTRGNQKNTKKNWVTILHTFCHLTLTQLPHSLQQYMLYYVTTVKTRCNSLTHALCTRNYGQCYYHIVLFPKNFILTCIMHSSITDEIQLHWRERTNVNTH